MRSEHAGDNLTLFIPPLNKSTLEDKDGQPLLFTCGEGTVGLGLIAEDLGLELSL